MGISETAWPMDSSNERSMLISLAHTQKREVGLQPEWKLLPEVAAAEELAMDALEKAEAAELLKQEPMRLAYSS